MFIVIMKFENQFFNRKIHFERNINNRNDNDIQELLTMFYWLKF